MYSLAVNGLNVLISVIEIQGLINHRKAAGVANTGQREVWCWPK